MAIDPNSHTPVFMQIVDHIRTGMAAGVYRPGEMLPSVRGLAVDLLVNPNTVQRAYEELEREGLVYSRRGIGLFVAKRGCSSARSQAQELAEKAFADAIRAARAANLSDGQIQEIFARTFADRQSVGGGTR